MLLTGNACVLVGYGIARWVESDRLLLLRAGEAFISLSLCFSAAVQFCDDSVGLLLICEGVLLDLYGSCEF